MIGRLNHVAIAVPNINESISLYKNMLGAKVSNPIELREHSVIVSFVELPNTKIELITPLNEKSPLNSFFKKNPIGGIHHVCFEVEDIIKSKDKLLSEGSQIVGNGSPSVGAHGKRVLFLHPKSFNGTLIELEEV